MLASEDEPKQVERLSVGKVTYRMSVLCLSVGCTTLFVAFCNGLAYIGGRGGIVLR